jgi:hypothetical protein
MNAHTRICDQIGKLMYLAFPPEPCGAQVVSDLDRAATESEMVALQRALTGKSWNELSCETLPRPIDSLLLLTDDSFAKIFPAYLLALCSPSALGDVEKDQIRDLVRWSIPQSPANDTGYACLRDEWWDSLNSHQQSVVVASLTVSHLDVVQFRLGDFYVRWLDWLMAQLNAKRQAKSHVCQ